MTENPGAASNSLLSKAYAWSVSFELLLFFHFIVAGVSTNISRYLQVAVILGIVLKWLMTSASARVNIAPLKNPIFQSYRLYLLVGVLAGVVGIVSGAFDVPYVLVNESSSDIPAGGSGTLRPAIEYAVTVYYFLYFTVLPLYLFNSEREVGYLLNVLRFTFIVSLVLGFLDLGLSALGIHFLPVSLAEHTFVGLRFHGLAGEPRDAFVYLFFGLAVLNLRAFWRGEKLGRWWFPTIIFAALMTQSASGIVGIILFVALYAVYNVGRLSLTAMVRLAALVILVVVFIGIAVSESERLQLYLRGASTIWYVLESGSQVPYVMAVQLVNIFPIYLLIVKIRNLDILPVLIGSGLGSSSVANSNFFASFAVRNPHSQLVRTLYETGIIGTVFFIRAFTKPVTYLTRNLSRDKRREFFLFTLLLLGCFLAHRSSASFIYLGALIAVFRVLRGKVPEPMLAMAPRS